MGTEEARGEVPPSLISPASDACEFLEESECPEIVLKSGLLERAHTRAAKVLYCFSLLATGREDDDAATPCRECWPACHRWLQAVNKAADP